MTETFVYLRELNMVPLVLRLVLAAMLGGFIGLERGRKRRPAGFRTYMLVCLGAALTMLIGQYNYTMLHSAWQELAQALGVQTDVSRLGAQVINGVGFLGAGMIIVKKNNVITGLTTAAGMWAAATIGIAIGYGFYLGALVGTGACVFTASFLTRLERKSRKSMHIYAEISKTDEAGRIAEEIRELLGPEALIEVSGARSGINGNIGLYITASTQSNIVGLISQKRKDIDTKRHEIEKIDGVAFAIQE